MKLIAHSDVEEFLSSVGSWLREDEEENSLILGIAARLAAGGSYGEGSPLFITVEEGGRPIAAALRTPPHNVVIHSKERPDPLEAIGEHLLEVDPDLPGVIGIVGVAGRFSQVFSERTGRAPILAIRQRLYSLRRVHPPSAVPGRLRRATEDDFDLLCRWISAFHDEAIPGDPLPDPGRVVERFMASGRVVLWDDGGPVSMAGSAGGTENGARISAVYTPPVHRGNGYASACVAGLSRMLLEGGKSFCTLFADLSNPTSNKIYQRIGYRPVVDYAVYSFAPAGRRT